MAGNERPESAVGNVMFHRRGVNLNVWITGDVEEDEERLRSTWAALDGFLRGLSDADREEVLKEQQRGGGGFGGRGGGRADRFPVIDGYECDQCHGPVGRKAKTGGMKTEAVVCLGSCQDPGKDGGRPFTHTVGWCNDDGTPGPKVPRAKTAASKPDAAPEKKERTVGDFLTWCQREHNLVGSEVFRILEVAGAADIRDLTEATKKVLAHVQQKVSA